MKLQRLSWTSRHNQAQDSTLWWTTTEGWWILKHDVAPCWSNLMFLMLLSRNRDGRGCLSSCRRTKINISKGSVRPKPHKEIQQKETVSCDPESAEENPVRWRDAALCFKSSTRHYKVKTCEGLTETFFTLVTWPFKTEGSGGKLMAQF